MTLKEIREITGLSATAFAKKYNIPPSTYIKWEMTPDAPGYRAAADYTKDLLERAVIWDYIGSKKYSDLEAENEALWKIIEQHGLSREAHKLASENIKIKKDPT